MYDGHAAADILDRDVKGIARIEATGGSARRRSLVNNIRQLGVDNLFAGIKQRNQAGEYGQRITGIEKCELAKIRQQVKALRILRLEQ